MLTTRLEELEFLTFDLVTLGTGDLAALWDVSLEGFWVMPADERIPS